MQLSAAPMTLTDKARCLEHNRVAIIDSSGTWTGREVLERAKRGATRLRPATRVALLVEPGADWVCSLLAIAEAGAVAIALSPLYPDRELDWLVCDAEADALIVSTAHRHRADNLVSVARTLETTALFAPGPSGPAALRRPEDTMLQLYTSGTTGKPKGVCIRDDNLCHQASLLKQAWKLGEDSHLLHALPLHHMHGIAVALLPTLLAGGCVTMLARFNATDIWDALDDANTLMAVPTMYSRLLSAFDAADETTRNRWAAHARALRLCTSGSAALPVTLADRWQQLHGAIPLERYGMTEIGVGLTNPFAPEERKRGWVGRPLPTVEIRLINEDGSDAGDGPGQIVTRGPSVFTAYWKRADATAQSFSEDWFKTGDRAERDAQGRYRILGRRSVDILKTGGYKVSALEIEEVLRDHPDVRDTAVVGIDDPDWGQRIVAAVVPEAQVPPARLATEALRAWLKQSLAAYKVPRQFVVVEALPRNAIGKVLKPALASELAARLA